MAVVRESGSECGAVGMWLRIVPTDALFAFSACECEHCLGGCEMHEIVHAGCAKFGDALFGELAQEFFAMLFDFVCTSPFRKVFQVLAVIQDALIIQPKNTSELIQ